MPKAYVLDDEIPVYFLYNERPRGVHTEEIELTEEELRVFRASEGAAAKGQDLVKAKLQELWNTSKGGRKGPF